MPDGTGLHVTFGDFVCRETLGGGWLPTKVPVIRRGSRGASPLLAFGAGLRLDLHR
jgi:hypothetical protein